MDKFEELLVAYGNAMFDCGAWDEDVDDEPYAACRERSKTAKKEIMDFYEDIFSWGNH